MTQLQYNHMIIEYHHTLLSGNNLKMGNEDELEQRFSFLKEAKM